MGIKGLTGLIGDVAPSTIKEDQIKNYFGRKIAIDASMSLYSFLVAVRMEGNQLLTNEMGETTSHLQGMFQRTIRLVEHGIKPVWVFDGKPPVLKSGELARRSKKKAEATEAGKAAAEEGNAEAEAKMAKRSVHVTREHNDDCKRLLRLLGMPVVEAPSEAEAQCAALCRAQKVWAVATEDMDALTFGAPLLLRHLTFAESRKLPIQELHLDQVLAGLHLTMDQFIDMCILCGCDYCDTIKGIGPKRALELITKHGSLEAVLKALDPEKHPLPPNFVFYEIRQLFKKPEVADPEQIDLKWGEPDEEGIIKFLCGEKQFSEDRVKKGLERLRKSKGTSVQGRLDGFFTVTGSTSSSTLKRKQEQAAKPAKAIEGKLNAKKPKAAPKKGK